MMKNGKSSSHEIFNWLEILVIFGIGLWLVVIRPLGSNLSRMPGDLGDTRFNNYILEHDFRWITGKDPSLLNAPIFYPYPLTLTFSDNHFGSMLFYDTFRWLGLDRESAFQAWYLLSYFLSFSAAAYVLKRFKLKPLAIGIGAFFFTFGLPLLAQEGHEQLFYRFCIPLACYSIWQFSQKPQFKQLVLTLFWLTWQFYLSIYIGYFLTLLLIVLALGLPFTQKISMSNMLLYWPRLVKQAWKNSKIKSDIIYGVLTSLFLLSMALLFQPYLQASNIYGFSRPWDEVTKMLPRIQSFFISDRSVLWQPFAYLSSKVSDYRQEQQLFIGGSALILLVLGLFWRFRSPHKKMALLFIGAAGFLVLLTINIYGFSFYKILWYLPGVDSIRAVSRIILVLMWPVAIFISIEVDALLNLSNKTFNFTAIALMFLGLMVAESVLFTHITYSKRVGDLRIQALREQIPSTLPKDPVLFVSNPDSNSWFLTELDAMLLSQDLGWPVMNGYSGNQPPGYGATTSCDQAIFRILRYMSFEKITDPSFYNNLISRLVPIGPENCQWPKELQALSVTSFSGPFSQELFSGISINILSITKNANYLVIQIDIENHSSQTLPALSSSGNPFRISWRIITGTQTNLLSGYDARRDLISDIPAGGHTLMTIFTSPPTEKGKYLVEVSAVQDGIAWFQERGMIPAESTQFITVDDSGQWNISN